MIIIIIKIRNKNIIIDVETRKCKELLKEISCPLYCMKTVENVISPSDVLYPEFRPILHRKLYRTFHVSC